MRCLRDCVVHRCVCSFADLGRESGRAGRRGGFHARDVPRFSAPGQYRAIEGVRDESASAARVAHEGEETVDSDV